MFSWRIFHWHTLGFLPHVTLYCLGLCLVFWHVRFNRTNFHPDYTTYFCSVVDITFFYNVKHQIFLLKTMGSHIPRDFHSIPSQNRSQNTMKTTLCKAEFTPRILQFFMAYYWGFKLFFGPKNHMSIRIYRSTYTAFLGFVALSPPGHTHANAACCRYGVVLTFFFLVFFPIGLSTGL